MLNMSLSIAMLSVHTSPLDLPGRTKDAGGMNVYMRELACALAQNNIKVDIFTRWTDEAIPQIVQLQPNVRVIHLQAGPLAPINKLDLYAYMPIFARRCEEFRQQEAGRYDIVHSHYWLSGIAGLQLAWQWDVPHIITFHTVARLKQLANPREPEPTLRLEMEQRLIQQADHIISPTADERAQVIRSCGAPASKVSVIPCGVDLDLFTPQDKQQTREALHLSSERPVLLFAGRLDPFKGPDVLLQAAALMEEKAQVLIVGGKLVGEDKEILALQELARQLDIADRVRFLGAQPRQEMPLVYSAADITVMPSYHESFGLVAVESLACAVPVIATRAGGLTMIVRHNETGFLVPRCPGFFAERLDALLRDNQLRAQMSAAARPSVQQFSWSSVGQQVADLYEDLALSESCLVAR